MQSHLEAALAYAARGWPVFPLMVKGKLPLIPKRNGGNGHLDATTDEAQIRKWWTDCPMANIGIRCGPESFCVIDIDKDNGGLESLARLSAEGKTFPDDTPAQRTGSGGCHICLKHDERIGCTTGKIAQGIDTRGNDRGYIVAAPSVHPNGEVYRWADLDNPLEEAPAWVFEALARPAEEPAPAVEPSAPVLADSNIEARARAYLETCEPAIQGQGGHAKLLWAARAMVQGFALDDGTAYGLLASVYNPRCVPPWNLGAGHDNREFRRKLDEAKKGGDKPFGWLRDDNQADTTALNQAREWADALIRSSRPPIEANRAPLEPRREAPVAPAVPREPPPVSQADIPPKHILYPIGLLGDMVSYINDTAPRPQPFLALANCLGFLGAMYGQKVRNQRNLRTNLYIVGLAGSGAGKDHSRQCIKRICTQSGAEGLLGPEDFTSDSAVFTAISGHGGCLCQMDELGHLFGNIRSNNASAIRKSIIPALLQIFSSAGSFMLGKGYAEEEKRKRIEQPHLCIYGTTVKSTLYDNLTTLDIRDGLLGRFIVCEVWDNLPSMRGGIDSLKAVPQSIVETISAWANHFPQAPADIGDIESAEGRWQIMVNTHPKAQALLDDLLADSERRVREDPNHPCAPLWVRAIEHATKVAMILAASECQNFKDIEMRRDHAEYGCEFTTWTMTRFVKQAAEHISDSSPEKWGKQIHQRVALAGAKGVPRREVARILAALLPRQREDVIRNLLEAEHIIQNGVGGGTRYFCPPHGVQA